MSTTLDNLRSKFLSEKEALVELLNSFYDLFYQYVENSPGDSIAPSDLYMDDNNIVEIERIKNDIYKLTSALNSDNGFLSKLTDEDLRSGLANFNSYSDLIKKVMIEVQDEIKIYKKDDSLSSEERLKKLKEPSEKLKKERDEIRKNHPDKLQIKKERHDEVVAEQSSMDLKHSKENENTGAAETAAAKTTIDEEIKKIADHYDELIEISTNGGLKLLSIYRKHQHSDTLGNATILGNEAKKLAELKKNYTSNPTSYNLDELKKLRKEIEDTFLKESEKINKKIESYVKIATEGMSPGDLQELVEEGVILAADPIPPVIATKVDPKDVIAAGSGVAPAKPAGGRAATTKFEEGVQVPRPASSITTSPAVAAATTAATSATAGAGSSAVIAGTGSGTSAKPIAPAPVVAAGGPAVVGLSIDPAAVAAAGPPITTIPTTPANPLTTDPKHSGDTTGATYSAAGTPANVLAGQPVVLTTKTVQPKPQEVAGSNKPSVKGLAARAASASNSARPAPATPAGVGGGEPLTPRKPEQSTSAPGTNPPPAVASATPVSSASAAVTPAPAASSLAGPFAAAADGSAQNSQSGSNVQGSVGGPSLLAAGAAAVAATAARNLGKMTVGISKKEYEDGARFSEQQFLTNLDSKAFISPISVKSYALEYNILNKEGKFEPVSHTANNSFKVQWANGASMERRFVQGEESHLEVKISANSTPEQIADALTVNMAFNKQLDLEPNFKMFLKIVEGASLADPKINIDQKSDECKIKFAKEDLDAYAALMNKQNPTPEELKLKDNCSKNPAFKDLNDNLLVGAVLTSKEPPKAQV